MPEHILYISSSGEVMGGAERCLIDISTRLGAYGWNPLVAVPYHGALAETLGAAGISVSVGELGVLRSRRELRSARLLLRLGTTIPAVLRLAALIRSTHVRVIHSNTSVVLAGALAARLTGLPHVWHVREILSGPAWRILRRLILALSDRVICISSAVADNVAPLGSSGRQRVTIIPDGIDLQHFSLVPPVSEGGELRIGMAGRINPMKGHELFLRVASLVSTRVPNARFFVAGGHIPAYESLYRDLLSLRSDLGLANKAHFVGHLERYALRDFMASLAVLVLPSTWPEGGGLVVLEAMALGRPVVASRHGGPVDIITDGVNGRLVTPGNANEMADVVVSLLQDACLRHRLGMAARQRVESDYGLSGQLNRLVAVYQEVCSRGG